MKYLLILIIFMRLNPYVEAQEIIKIIGERIHISNGEDLKVGKYYYIIDSTGAKKGVIVIDTVIADVGKATLYKGELKLGWKVINQDGSPITQKKPVLLVENQDKPQDPPPPVAPPVAPQIAPEKALELDPPPVIKKTKVSKKNKLISDYGFDFDYLTGSMGVKSSKSANSSLSTSGFGFTLSNFLWSDDIEYILPSLSYSTLNFKQGSISASGSSLDLGIGIGYIFDDSDLKISFEYFPFSQVNVSTTPSVTSNSGYGFYVSLIYFYDQQYAGLIAYRSISYEFSSSTGNLDLLSLGLNINF